MPPPESQASAYPPRCPCAQAGPVFTLPPESGGESGGMDAFLEEIGESRAVLHLGALEAGAAERLAGWLGPRGWLLAVEYREPLARLMEETFAAGFPAGAAPARLLKGRFHDLRTDLARAESWLAAHPARDLPSWMAFEAYLSEQRRENPLVADESIDAVILRGFFNPLAGAEKRLALAEIRRVLRPGGLFFLEEIAASRELPGAIRQKPEVWSPSVAGALTREQLHGLFMESGSKAPRFLDLPPALFRAVKDIEFRPVALIATWPETPRASL